MSIDIGLLKTLIVAGNLVVVPPLVIGARHPRVILAIPSLYEDLMGTGPTIERRIVVSLRADLDTFIMGDPVTIGGAKHKHADLKPLARAYEEMGFSSHEVWEYRSVDPKPAIRLFGRFARRNVFVATGWRERTWLGEFGSLEWRREIRRCKYEWNKVFSSRPPLQGASVHDYISDPVVDLRH